MGLTTADSPPVDPAMFMQTPYAYAHASAGYSGDATAAIEAQIERVAPAALGGLDGSRAPIGHAPPQLMGAQ
jgi:hypothetical protein